MISFRTSGLLSVCPRTLTCCDLIRAFRVIVQTIDVAIVHIDVTDIIQWVSKVILICHWVRICITGHALTIFATINIIDEVAQFIRINILFRLSPTKVHKVICRTINLFFTILLLIAVFLTFIRF